jgi:general secretion pathway protein E
MTASAPTLDGTATVPSSLAEIIVQRFGLSPEALAEAAAAAAEKGEPLAKVLAGRSLLTEERFQEAVALFYDLPFYPELTPTEVDLGVAERVPIQFLKFHLMVPLKAATLSPPLEGDEWVIAVKDPGQFQPIDELVRRLAISAYRLVVAPGPAILSAINICYEFSHDSAEQLVQDMEENDPIVIHDLQNAPDLLEDASEAPIIKLVNHIISQSVKAGASDIHIEAYQDQLKVRYRIDGILYDMLTPPRWIHASLISRIKVMARLNIAERRLPQDGRIEIKLGNQEIDVRVSTLPTTFGERVVLRLLNKSKSLISLPELGLSDRRLEQIRTLIASPNGIILVTGPTGSGKTTTLYAVLQTIKTPDINIITIEDPVEYQIAGISQIQVNPKIDLTFARGLRAIVRQDPDVILVGEIRDQETADIAVQSALTGHLVFSTLHTNDSAGAMTRLVDIGVEPFLICSAVIAVIAQRLVRQLCPFCRAGYRPEDAALRHIDIDPARLDGRELFRAVGCPQCFHTGYRGRIAIFEIMELTAALKSLLLKTFDANQIKAQALADGLITLRQDGIDKALAGVTTLDEVLRVTHR